MGPQDADDLWDAGDDQLEGLRRMQRDSEGHAASGPPESEILDMAEPKSNSQVGLDRQN